VACATNRESHGLIHSPSPLYDFGLALFLSPASKKRQIVKWILFLEVLILKLFTKESTLRFAVFCWQGLGKAPNQNRKVGWGYESSHGFHDS
jgi:hypothetical protein